MPVILGAIIERLIVAHQNKPTRRHAKKPEKLTLFPKLSIDMIIQLQVLSVHASSSQLYIL